MASWIKGTLAVQSVQGHQLLQVQEIWLSYLREVSSTIPFEDDIIETKNYVQSQISLLVMDIMDDKI